MAHASATLEELHARCTYASFAVRARAIHEVHATESLWKDAFGSFHNYIAAHGHAVYG